MHILTEESNNFANAIVLDKVGRWLSSEQSVIPPEPKTIDVAPVSNVDWSGNGFEIPEQISEPVFGQGFESYQETKQVPKTTVVETPAMPTADPKVIKTLEREWREHRAVAKGKTSTGKSAEARAVLEEFRKKVTSVAGAQDLLAKIDSEIAGIPADAPASAPAPKNPVRPRQVPPAVKPAKPEPKTPPSLIPQHKIKEARDNARADGNTGKAKILSDIIRAERSISTRKGSLEECRRTKDKTQIERIVKELDEYIALCQKGGVDAEDYSKLRMDYRRIIK